MNPNPEPWSASQPEPDEFWTRSTTTIHDKKGISICEVCDKTFTSKKILKIHVNTIHGNTNESKDKLHQIKLKKSFVDEIVEKQKEKFQIKSQLKCNLCGKNFNSKSNLSRHLKSLHLQIDKKDCESCNKTFSDAHTLKRHIAIVHEKKGITKCELCDKNFLPWEI